MPLDHIVPQLYLRRFAEQRRGRGHFTIARPLAQLDEPFPTNVRNVAAENGFYDTTTDDGEVDRALDKVLQLIETRAAPAFSMVLDDHNYVFPMRWPLDEDTRGRLTWWMAAQILRTTRQRSRLAHLLDGSDELELPRPLSEAAARDVHVRYIVEELSRLAYILTMRPWGLGMSDGCLWTSDVPVVVLNDQDAEDQPLATGPILARRRPRRHLRRRTSATRYCPTI